MTNETQSFNGLVMPVFRCGTLVIGTGCAGLNAADWLRALGQEDVLIVTEGMYMGTSRNTGSDKQTYYKLSVAADDLDSVEEMAQTLFSGCGVEGEVALCEAAGSLQAFYKLTLLGVPFPTNEYGEFVGYRTDHDPRRRATSAGPLTSRYMTEALERSVKARGVKIHDGIQILRLLTTEGRVCGALGMKRATGGYCLYKCRQIIAAMGGPAMAYRTSVYPKSQTGGTGMLLMAGATMRNLQEWQYGLASLSFRWNVSGAYQQVLPRYVSVDERGNEYETLTEYFKDAFAAVDRVFLKGYQWPFDADKARGSSLIDVIVHHEMFDRGRRVYMDFTRNPSCIDQLGFEPLSEETRSYLLRSDALGGTPIQRLRRMNPDAIELYRAHSIDLEKEWLEIGVCAQHCNGGAAVDCHWQTRIEGLYVAGEAAGTFGAYRPGGSALNSTQVGSQRAAEHITSLPATKDISEEAFAALVRRVLEETDASARRALLRGGKPNLSETIERIQTKMSACAAHIRDVSAMSVLSQEIAALLEDDGVTLEDESRLPLYHKLRDTLITQLAMLDAMMASAKRYQSHGSSMLLDDKGEALSQDLHDYRMLPPLSPQENAALYTTFCQNRCESVWKPVGEIPARDAWFETVWSNYQRRTLSGGARHPQRP